MCNHDNSYLFKHNRILEIIDINQIYDLKLAGYISTDNILNEMKQAKGNILKTVVKVIFYYIKVN